ncbi:MAG TPA: carboxylesterase family protein, partial [Actinomycetes bacterium]|nr:carboxylesterase family protein [Actinomycetes bacterium]
MRLRSPSRRGRIMLLAAAVLTGLGMLAGTAVSVSANSAIACTAGTTVQTTNGPVCGIVDNGVSQWLGIPFAAPPVGDLRWAPPQPPQPWTSTLQATD